MRASPPDRTFSRLRRIATWTAMVVGPLLFWGAVALWSMGAPLFLFLVPVPAWLISLRFLRFETPLPDDQLIDDWGVRLGQPWVRIGHRTHWVSREQLHQLAAHPEDVAPTLTHDGFVLDVPAPHSGLPNQAYSTGMALVACVLPSLLALGVFFTVSVVSQPADLGPAAAFVVSGTLCSVIGHGMLLAPWAFLEFLARAALAGWEGATPVRLHGRVVEANGKSFLLGQQGQTITHEQGTLTLENPTQTLVIRGAAAHLAFLSEAFQRATRQAGSAADVPEELRRLHGKVGQPA